MGRVSLLCGIFFNSLVVYATTGEIWVNIFSGENGTKWVIGILENKEQKNSVVAFRKDLEVGKYSFKVKEGEYLVVCMRYSYNHSLQTHPIVVKGDSVTEVVCKGIPSIDLIELEGTVIDKDTGLPIVGAKVGDYPFLLPPELLSNYTHVIKTKTTRRDLGDIVRFLKKYKLDKYFYSLTDNRGRFKTFVYSKAIASFKSINFSVFADGYTPFFYQKRVKNISKIESPLDVGSVELVTASSCKLSFVPPLKKDVAIFLKPVNTEIVSYPKEYFIFSPYRRLGTSSKSPIFVKDKFVWPFVYPWIYSVEWRIKRSKKRGVKDATSSLAVYEIKEKDNKEIALDINECKYRIGVVREDSRDSEDQKLDQREDFDFAILWRDRYWVVDSIGIKDLRKPVEVGDIVRGKSFIKIFIGYGDEEEVFVEEIGIKYKKRLSATYFYSRVRMDDCTKNKDIVVTLEKNKLSFVIKDNKGKPVKNAYVSAYLYREGYDPPFSCGTQSNEKGKAICKYLKSGEYLVFVHHPRKGYFGPESFSTSKDSYEITLKEGKDIEVELFSPEYKSIGKGLVIVAALKDTPFSIFSTLGVEGEKEKPYRILGPPSDKEEKYVAKFSNLPYQDIYIFPETQVTKLGKGWSRTALLLDAKRSGSVQLVLGSESGTVVFEGKNTGLDFDDGYRISVCKKGAECLPPSFFTPNIFASPTGGFVITGLSPGEYKVRLIPIDLGEGRESLETLFFKIYADQHTIVEEGSFRR